VKGGGEAEGGVGGEGGSRTGGGVGGVEEEGSDGRGGEVQRGSEAREEVLALWGGLVGTGWG